MRAWNCGIVISTPAIYTEPAVPLPADILQHSGIHAHITTQWSTHTHTLHTSQTQWSTHTHTPSTHYKHSEAHTHTPSTHNKHSVAHTHPPHITNIVEHTHTLHTHCMTTRLSKCASEGSCVAMVTHVRTYHSVRKPATFSLSLSWSRIFMTSLLDASHKFVLEG